MKDKKNFIKEVKKLLVDKKIHTIKDASICEFKLGKNYFYKIKNDKLTNVQKWLHDYCKHIPLNHSAVAFRKDLSYLHLFEPHRKNYHFLRLDIRSFFHSIEVDDIRNVFKEYISETEYLHKDEQQSYLDAFIRLVTYKVPKNSSNKKFIGKQILPMGFKTSPIISNIIFRQIDIQIQKLCSPKKIEYTRYADDMLFSSSKDLFYIHSDGFIKEIRIIIKQMNFKLNEKKTLKAKHTLSLNGYTIQYDKKDYIPPFHIEETRIINEVRLSNKKTNIIKKMIFMIENEKKDAHIILKKLFNYKIKFDCDKETYEKYNKVQLLHKVLGYRSYLLSIVQFDKKYHCTQKDTIAKYLKIVKDLEIIAEKYQIRIDKLERIIEKKRKSLKDVSNILIDSLIFTDWEKNKLKEANYKTLKDLYFLKKEDLIKIKGIGKVKAENIIEIIKNEIKKYK